MTSRWYVELSRSTTVILHFVVTWWSSLVCRDGAATLFSLAFDFMDRRCGFVHFRRDVLLRLPTRFCTTALASSSLHIYLRLLRNVRLNLITTVYTLYCESGWL